MSVLNLEEFRKSMYPNCMKTSLAFNHKLNKCVLSDTCDYTCFMSYFLKDDYYDVSFFQSIEEIDRLSSYRSLFIFRFVCNKEIFDYLGKENTDGRIEEISEILNNKDFRMTYDDEPFLNILTVENFPDVSLSNKLNKSEFNDRIVESYPRYKRNLYLNITSNDKFECDYETEALILSECEDSNELKSMIYVRIIGYIIDGKMEFDIDINSGKESYDYDDYEVWLYAIPDSNISRILAIDLLFNKFKEAYNNYYK